MELKDYITVTLSGAALIISIFSNIFQKNKETARSIRKTLSDTLESIAKINIELAKLRQTTPQSYSQATIDLRRNYTGQSRILTVHADFLCQKYPDMVTEIDCNLLAGSFSTIGDYEKADSYWKKTIEKSFSSPIRHMNLRGYARFLYYQGKFEQGRSRYKEALEIEMPDTDNNRRIITDTYVMWATVEREFNNFSEFKRLIDIASSYCSRIGHKKMREEMENQIKEVSPNQERNTDI